MYVIGVLLVVAFTWWVGTAELGFSMDTGDATLPDWARRPDNVITRDQAVQLQLAVRGAQVPLRHLTRHLTGRAGFACGWCRWATCPIASKMCLRMYMCSPCGARGLRPALRCA